ncbi:coiled-coil domain-containing protein 167-like isoform X1 [Tubulanus polymorphus]|uniref:coiled-coil domain-containing protein 167-like isoform X1 n=1 Tax=Tubulanus polymorphus TaxID=672921 RepID=UPI003DA2BDF8
MPSVVKEIDSVEEKVKNCEKKLDKLERRLRLANITDEERRKLKEDEKQLQNTLKGHQKQLRSLRWENMKSMAISVLIILMAYITYTVFWDTNNSN